MIKDNGGYAGASNLHLLFSFHVWGSYGPREEDHECGHVHCMLVGSRRLPIIPGFLLLESDATQPTLEMGCLRASRRTYTATKRKGNSPLMVEITDGALWICMVDELAQLLTTFFSCVVHALAVELRREGPGFWMWTSFDSLMVIF